VSLLNHSSIISALMIIMNNKFLMKIIWLNELFIDLFFKELRWHPEEVAGINLTHMFNLEG